jgi:hypothetical protein
MKRGFLLFCLVFIGLLSCKKDNANFATGTVLNQNGCGNDYYLVVVDNPDFTRHEFLRPSFSSSCAMCFNCSNSAFVLLPSSLTAPGTRIRFSFAESIPSCLSSSEAPEHIKVKTVVKL